MSRSKHLAAYPSQLIQLTQAVYNHTEIALDFPTRQELERVRMQWYGFVRAALREAPEIGRQAQAVICRIRDNQNGTWTIIFSHRDDDTVMARLTAAINQQLPTQAPRDTPQNTFDNNPYLDPYEAYLPPDEKPGQSAPRATSDAQSTAAFEAAIEAWLDSPDHSPDHTPDQSTKST